MSHTTVSRALNDHPAISDATKKRIHKEAVRAGYIPNSAARMLKQQNSRILGLVIPDIKNAFYTSVAQIVADSAALRGWQMILATTDDNPEREMAAVRSLLEARAEGVILSPCAKPLPDTIAMLRRLNAVQFLRTVKSLSALPSVEIDDPLGIELATLHLVKQGHRRIAYIGAPANLSTGKNRLKGYKKALAKSGIPLRPEYSALGPPRPAFGATAFRQIMSRRPAPSAIIIGSPEIAEGVLIEAMHADMRISVDLAIVSYGELSWHEVIPGGITSVHLPEREIAHASFERLMSGKRSTGQHRTLIKPSLHIRGSSLRRG